MKKGRLPTREEYFPYKTTHPGLTLGLAAQRWNVKKEALQRHLAQWGEVLPDPPADRAAAQAPITPTSVMGESDLAPGRQEPVFPRIPADTLSNSTRRRIWERYMEDSKAGRATDPSQSLDALLEEGEENARRVAELEPYKQNYKDWCDQVKADAENRIQGSCQTFREADDRRTAQLRAREAKFRLRVSEHIRRLDDRAAAKRAADEAAFARTHSPAVVAVVEVFHRAYVEKPPWLAPCNSDEEFAEVLATAFSQLETFHLEKDVAVAEAKTAGKARDAAERDREQAVSAKTQAEYERDLAVNSAWRHEAICRLAEEHQLQAERQATRTYADLKWHFTRGSLVAGAESKEAVKMRQEAGSIADRMNSVLNENETLRGEVGQLTPALKSSMGERLALRVALRNLSGKFEELQVQHGKLLQRTENLRRIVEGAHVSGMRKMGQTTRGLFGDDAVRARLLADVPNPTEDVLASIELFFPGLLPGPGSPHQPRMG